MLAFLVMAWYY